MNYTIDIPNATTSVTNSVSRSIMQELIQSLNLPKIHSINRQSDTEYLNKHWNLGKTERDMESRTLQLEYTVETDYQVERLATAMYKQNDAIPILQDKNLLIRPMKLETNLRFNIKLESKNKSDIYSTINDLRLKLVYDATANYHTVVYHYFLPDYLKELLNHLYSIKKQVVPLENFIEYLSQISDKRMSITADVADVNRDITVKETVGNVLGLYETDLANIKPEFDKDTGMYSIELEYKITIDLPTHLLVYHEIIYYNQILDNRFIEVVGNNTYSNGYNTSGNEAMDTMSNLSSKTEKVLKRLNSMSYIHIPIEDRVEYDLGIYTGIFSALLTVDENPHYLCSLFELGDIELDSILLSFLSEGEYKYLLNHLDSIFTIKYFVDNREVSVDNLSIDKELRIYSKTALDPTSVHRIVFCVIDRPRLLLPGAYDRYLKWRDRLIGTIPILNPTNADVEGSNTVNEMTRCMVNSNASVKEQLSGVSKVLSEIGISLEIDIFDKGLEIKQAVVLTDNIIKIQTNTATIFKTNDRVSVYHTNGVKECITRDKKYRLENGVYTVYNNPKRDLKILKSTDIPITKFNIRDMHSNFLHGMQLLTVDIPKNRSMMKTVNIATVIAHYIGDIDIPKELIKAEGEIWQ